MRIDRIVGKKLTAVVSVQGASLTERVRGISIGELHASECYYGFDCQENGGDVVIWIVWAGCKKVGERMFQGFDVQFANRL